MADARSGNGAGRDGVIELGARRRLTFRSYGDPNGRVVLALHGTPGSRLKFAGTETPAAALGLRIIAPDRWGYGGTSPHPSPTLTGFVADMQRLVDALGTTDFAVMGVSGGGPYAAAMAAILPDRVGALALVAPVGPIAGALAELSLFHRFCFGPLARRPRAVATIFRGFYGMLRASPSLGVRIGNIAVPAADRRVLRSSAVRMRLATTFLEGLRSGAQGPAIDLDIFTRPWNVALEQARMPASLWLGTADRNVPLAAARRLASVLPACRLEELPGEGHLWVAEHYADVLGWIAGTLRVP